MKALTYALLLFVLSGCSSSAKNIGHSFYDSHGKSYHSSTASLNLEREYQLDGKPGLVIVATTSENVSKFKQQMSVIHKVNPEQMQYLYVIANSEKEDVSGYYTEKIVAKKILAGDSFKIIIYDEKGKVLRKSTEVIGEEKLRYYLAKDPS